MRNKIKKYVPLKSHFFILVAALAMVSCGGEPTITKEVHTPVFISPDYMGVTIPPNIAPMNFKIRTGGKDAYVIVSGNGEEYRAYAPKGEVKIPLKLWRKLTEANRGGVLTYTICLKDNNEWVSHAPFIMNVAEENCDSYLSYRLIEPAYEMWNEMGLYQRNVENFDVSLIFSNMQTEKGCINCHSFAAQDASNMLFHVRKMNPGMVMVRDGKIEQFDTKTDQTISPLVYPSWHPGGKYVAFSTNNTILTYHMKDPNTAEVYDDASDVVVYDTEKQEVFTLPCLSSPDDFETFPTFSADGRTLYFCTAPAMAMPESYNQMQYSLCSVSFDPETGTIGEKVDTLFNATKEGKSLSFPRFSPDGKWMMFTRHNYGSFPIWHKDADLWMLNLSDGSFYPLTAFNSDESDSYHSWSSNSRWVAFSSRRQDGWYTRLYFGYVDKDGVAHKPFILPQEDLLYDTYLMKSYNIPEFTKNEVEVSPYEISNVVRNKKPKRVTAR